MDNQEQDRQPGGNQQGKGKRQGGGTKPSRKRRLTRAEKVAASMEKVRGHKRNASTAIGDAMKAALDKMVDVIAEASAVVESPAPSTGEIGAFAIGNDSYRFYDDGRTEFLRGRRVYTMPPAISTRAELEDTVTVSGIPIPTGLTVIFGGADEGKSPLLRFIGREAAKIVPTASIRFGEPFPDYLRDTESLARAIVSAIAWGDMPRVITVDSFKNIVGRIGGNATKGGMSRELFPWFSDMSSFLAEAGVSMVTVLNISSAQRAVIDEAVEGLSSNCTATWQLESGRIEWQARVGEGKRRRSGSAVITWGGDGLIDRLHHLHNGHDDQIGWAPVTGSSDGMGSVNVIHAVDIDPTDMHRAVSRLVRSSTRQR